jgi:hypothetical protein
VDSFPKERPQARLEKNTSKAGEECCPQLRLYNSAVENTPQNEAIKISQQGHQNLHTRDNINSTNKTTNLFANKTTKVTTTWR